MPPCSPVPGSMSLQRPPESVLGWAGPPSARTGCALLRYSQLSSHQPPASPGDTHLTSPHEQTFLFLTSGVLAVKLRSLAYF